MHLPQSKAVVDAAVAMAHGKYLRGILEENKEEINTQHVASIPQNKGVYTLLLLLHLTFWR